jgi:predicted PurR-regulated permease PerM
MILAIILGTSALLAAWAGYWWSSVLLGAKANRASRTASIISPFLIAGVFAWAADPLVDAYGIDLQSLMNWHIRGFAAIFFAVAIVFLIPTVLIAMIVGELHNKRTAAKN